MRALSWCKTQSPHIPGDPEQSSALFTEGPIFAFDCIALLLHRGLPGVRKRVNNGVEKEDRDDCGGDPRRPIAHS